MSYKRNQIEEAIARIFDPDSQKPPSELRTRIKRLLELDRSIGRKVRSKDPEEANFAFFSEEAPGTGADILFSEYEAFALLNGLRIMDHGWPQSFAVSMMRRVRVDLESEHARILRRGAIAAENTDPVFLTIASISQPSPDVALLLCAVCHGSDDVSSFSGGVGASSVTTFEVATLIHTLHSELMKTAPRRRGRGSELR
jgi:hypothetical protein